MVAVSSAGAETIATENGIAVKQADVATPARGMSMDEVAAKFGAPVTKVPAVGRPPIARCSLASVRESASARRSRSPRTP